MDTVTFEVAPGITAIDTFMGGRERYTAAYLLEAAEPTLIETGPTTSVDPVTRALVELGIASDQLANVVVTHIHLDHAGGVGGLAASFPRARIWVQEQGAPHLADPSRLVASATRLYGPERMATLFGPPQPVPAGRVRPLVDGDRVEMGNRTLEVLYTPGHARHHVALVDSDTGAVFTGDALGIHVPNLPILRPATPPPEFDLELAVDSIHRIRDRAPSLLLFAHFGPISEVDRTCELAERRVRDWAAVVRDAMASTDDLDEIVAILTRETAREVATGAEAQLDLDRLETLSSIRMNALGIIRYWTKRAEARAEGAQAERDAEGAKRGTRDATGPAHDTAQPS
jgi:glyoxylase-like metal-dependent hydrolase (beta-lactamase superfamily II)